MLEILDVRLRNQEAATPTWMVSKDEQFAFPHATKANERYDKRRPGKGKAHPTKTGQARPQCGRGAVLRGRRPDPTWTSAEESLGLNSCLCFGTLRKSTLAGIPMHSCAQA